MNTKTRRPRVYVAGPITRGDLLHNVQQADAAMLALLKAGCAPFNPMLSVYCGGAKRGQSAAADAGPVYATADRKANGGFQDITHAEWLDMDFAWIEPADALLRLPGESTGAEMEIAHATEHGVPVFFDLAELLEYLKRHGMIAR